MPPLLPDDAQNQLNPDDPPSDAIDKWLYNVPGTEDAPNPDDVPQSNFWSDFNQAQAEKRAELDEDKAPEEQDVRELILSLRGAQRVKLQQAARGGDDEPIFGMTSGVPELVRQVAQEIDGIVLKGEPLPMDLRRDCISLMVFGVPESQAKWPGTSHATKTIDAIAALGDVENPAGRYGPPEAHRSLLDEKLKPLVLDHETRRFLIETHLVGRYDRLDALADFARRTGRPVSKIEQIGKGAQGSVFRLTLAADNPELALSGDPAVDGIIAATRKTLVVKIANPGRPDDLDRPNIGRENRLVKVLHALKAGPAPIAHDETHRFLATEGEPGDVTLEKCIDDLRARWPETALGLALLLKKIHDAHVVHRDIKLENILRRPDGTFKLIDAGTARNIATEPILESDEPRGTPSHMPWEALQFPPQIGDKTDVYALGSMLLHLRPDGKLWNYHAAEETGDRPGMVQTIQSKLKADEAAFDRALNRAGVDDTTRPILRRLLHPDFKKRATTDEAITLILHAYPHLRQTMAAELRDAGIS
jgi:hypothetical protein